MRVSAGLLSELPSDRCISVAAGRAVVALVGGEAVAFENRCLHQESPLAGGYIRDGVLMCPLHFWRYRLPSGDLIGQEATLPRYETEVVDGEVFVEVPDPDPPQSMRERLLAHAKEWDAGR